jgi:predicted metalloprotease with PDZ domain
MRLRNEQGRTVVDTVFADGPAYHADISSGDELIAMDGYRVSKESLGDRLADRQPGERVTLTFFRRDELRDVELTLGQRPYNKVTIAPMAAASAAQKRIYERWLGAAWSAYAVEASPQVAQMASETATV